MHRHHPWENQVQSMKARCFVWKVNIFASLFGVLNQIPVTLNPLCEYRSFNLKLTPFLTKSYFMF
uniref:Uncharacterized protein n=1 Tax=Medicago truncatula TaxID=3880 RepID=B7FFP8_MEDTR|nr:unknown [Medicago truncatula]